MCLLLALWLCSEHWIVDDDVLMMMCGEIQCNSFILTLLAFSLSLSLVFRSKLTHGGVQLVTKYGRIAENWTGVVWYIERNCRAAH